VAIIVNIEKPETKNCTYWPNASFFGIYDGHGGVKCAEFLKNNLHHFIINDSNYPNDIKKSIENGILYAEKEYQSQTFYNNQLFDRSGSCAIVVLIVGNGA
jgi:protein phosphatase 2C family protein 2/3